MFDSTKYILNYSVADNGLGHSRHLDAKPDIMYSAHDCCLNIITGVIDDNMRNCANKYWGGYPVPGCGPGQTLDSCAKLYLSVPHSPVCTPGCTQDLPINDSDTGKVTQQCFPGCFDPP